MKVSETGGDGVGPMTKCSSSAEQAKGMEIKPPIEPKDRLMAAEGLSD